MSEEICNKEPVSITEKAGYAPPKDFLELWYYEKPSEEHREARKHLIKNK